MAIKIDYCKGQNPLDPLTEYSNFIKKRKNINYQKKIAIIFKKWKEERGYFSEGGKIELHSGNLARKSLKNFNGQPLI